MQSREFSTLDKNHFILNWIQALKQKEEKENY